MDITQATPPPLNEYDPELAMPAALAPALSLYPRFRDLAPATAPAYTDVQYRSNPTTVTESASFGTTAWTNVGNAIVWDTNYASCTITSTQQTRFLVWTGFGFAIPSDATVTGVTVVAYGYASDASFSVAAARLVVGGVIGATNFADVPKTWATVLTDYSGITVGRHNDMAGWTLTPAQVNASDFGVALAFSRTGAGSQTVYISAVRVNVYYRTPEEPAGTTDMQGLPFWSGSLVSSFWCPPIGAFQPVDWGRREMNVVYTAGGYSIRLRGRETQMLHIPVRAEATTLSIRARYDSAYAGSNLPQIVLLADLGVPQLSATMTAGPNTWQQLTIGPFTPAKAGTMRLVLRNRSTALNGLAYFDDFTVT